ncbi:hypothetical protein C8J56DRAFT_807090, partial [Mycena floridula]
AAHIILAVYHTSKGKFIPVQLYFDVMCMVKNAYFCVAKTQIDNPRAKFFLILLGTDNVEKLFGIVRTKDGTNSSADQLQLTNCIDDGVQCTNILSEHPEWGGESRRLHLKALSQINPADVSSKYDHLNPASWRGGVHVRNASCLSAWQQGRKQAESILEAANIACPFEMMEERGGFDILCPFGNDRMVLVNGLNDGEEDETEEEQSQYQPPPTDTSSAGVNMSACPDSESFDLEPDIEDLALDAKIDSEAQQDTQPYEPWIAIDAAGTGKKIHKASVLRLYSDPFTTIDSKDRLKRVRGFEQYDSRKGVSVPQALSPLDETSSVFSVDDPVVTLVECDGRFFTAIGQVCTLSHCHPCMRHRYLQRSLLHEPNVSLDLQIMKLTEINSQHQPDGPDWEWTFGRFEEQLVKRLPGHYAELINPDWQASKAGSRDVQTYVFQTKELCAVSLLVAERIRDDGMSSIPSVKLTASFPYRSQTDTACFACETLDQKPHGHNSKHKCHFCSHARISEWKIPAVLNHNAAHILHDPRLKDLQPCGLCLATAPACKIFLKVSSKTITIDFTKSECPQLRPFQLKAAKAASLTAPSTNHPRQCPLCPAKSPAVWSYNLRAHIIHDHPRADLALYESEYSISGTENTLLLGVFQTKPRNPTKKARSGPKLKISAAHTSSAAFQ